jgi:ketosteroid isomerase-like protein
MTTTTETSAASRNSPSPCSAALDAEPSPAMLMGDLPAGSPKGALMPATTPEQIHQLFENRFNAGDLDGLMELYEPDVALIAQPGSVANGIDQARAALQGFLSLKGRITLDTKLVVTVDELAYLSNTWSLHGTDPDGNPVTLGATTAEVARRQADGSWRYVIDNAWGDQAVTD